MKHTRPVELAAEPAPGQRIGRIARISALIWAGWWTLYLAALLVWLYMTAAYGATIAARNHPSLTQLTPFGRGCYVVVPALVLIPWAGAAIAWRRPRTGAVVVLLAGFLAPVVLAPPHGVFGFDPGAWDGLLCTVPIALPTLAAAFVLLASWWRSRRVGFPQDSEHDAG
jgi:hypothetical protein